jgi:hypothetical protein
MTRLIFNILSASVMGRTVLQARPGELDVLGISFVVAIDRPSRYLFFSLRFMFGLCNLTSPF